MDNNNQAAIPPKHSNELVGHLLIFTSTLFFGLNVPALKILLPEWLDFADATAMRLVGAAVLYWIVSLFVKKQKIDPKDWFLLIFCGMIGLYFFIYFFSLAIQYGSPVDVSIIMTLPPIMVVLISAVLYKSAITGGKILGVMISLVGALLIIMLQHHAPGATRSLKGNLFAVASSVCYAIYLVAIKRPSQKYHPVILLRWIFLSSSLPAILIAFKGFAQARLFTHPEIEPIAIISFVVIFPTFVSYLLIPPAINKIGQEIVSMYQYLIPVIATIASVVLKIDKLEWDQPVAAAIILIGVYITSRAGKKKKKGVS